MAFVQLIDCRTSRIDDLDTLMDDWVRATQGKRTATHSVMGRDRADSTHVVEIVEFPSYEEAMQNSQLPETDRIYRDMVAVCDGEPTITDLEVVRDDQLNKILVRAFFQEVVNGRNTGLQDALCTPDYQERWGSMPDAMSLQESQRAYGEIHTALEPVTTVQGLVEEGEMVSARFSIRGRHVGALWGNAPSGREFTVTGHATFRCRNSRIAESWWNVDDLTLLRQIGAVDA